jgi:predicted small lipoprotein YifL
MKPIRHLLYCVLGCCVVASCGQKGSLYLPQAEPEPVSVPAAETDGDEAGTEDVEENG